MPYDKVNKSKAKAAEPDDRHEREEDPEKDAKFEYDINAINMAFDFAKSDKGKQALRRISDHVKDNVKSAQENSQTAIDRQKQEIALYLGELPDKPPPFVGAAQVHLPLMLKTLTRLSARVCGELFADWKNFVVVLPTSIGADEEVAQRLSKHTNWQLSTQIPDFQRQAEIAVDWFFFYGDVTCHSTYDTATKTNRHEMLAPDEFIVPAVSRTTMPDYSDVPYVARIMKFFPHQLEEKKDAWLDVDKVLEEIEASVDEEPEEALSAEAKKVSGVDDTEEKDAVPYKVIWYEGWLTLPKQKKDEEDRPARYCKVIFHYDSGTIFHLSLHEQENWQDRARFDKQSQELMAYRAAVQQYIAQRDQMQGQFDQIKAAHDASLQAVPGGDPRLIQAMEQIGQGMAQAGPPPPAPQWAENADDPNYQPEAVRMEPIHLFAHAVCIEPPAGPRGVSFGRIEADFNRAADTALSQFIDAATLNNMKPFLAKDGVEFKGKAVVQAGKIMHITGFDGQDIRESIVPLDISPGNPQLVQVVQMCAEFAEEAIQAPGVMAGEPGKSGETARGYSMRIEQATKQLTSAARKVARFLQQVIKNNAALNAKFLAEEEFIAVQDPTTQQWQQIPMSRKLYERNYMVEFRTDMTFTSRAQKIGEADGILQMIGSIPQLAMDIPLIRYALGKSFEARGLKDYSQFLGPQPGPPQTPLGMPPPPPQAPPGQPAAGGPPQGPTGAPQGQPGAVPPGQSPGPAPKGQPSPPAPKAAPPPGG